MSLGTASTVVKTSATETTENVKSVATPAWRKGFWSLVITQFQGAFNENGLKNLVIFLILGMAMQKADRDRLVLIVGTLFSLPFILFSMTGGFLADRYQQAHRHHLDKVFRDRRHGAGHHGTGLAQPEP